MKELICRRRANEVMRQRAKRLQVVSPKVTMKWKYIQWTRMLKNHTDLHQKTQIQSIYRMRMKVMERMQRLRETYIAKLQRTSLGLF